MQGSSAGWSLMLGHLAPIMPLQMLRISFSSNRKADSSLSPFSHPQLSRVLDALQMRFQESWSLDRRAEFANMLRSGFALRPEENGPRTNGLPPELADADRM
jgi:hypothetical protein